VYPQQLIASDSSGTQQTIDFFVNILADCSLVAPELLPNGDTYSATFQLPLPSEPQISMGTTFNKIFEDSISLLTTVPSSCGALEFSLSPAEAFLTFDASLPTDQIQVFSTDEADIGTHVFDLSVTMVDHPAVTLQVPDFFTLTVDADKCSSVSIFSTVEESELL